MDTSVQAKASVCLKHFMLQIYVKIPRLPFRYDFQFLAFVPRHDTHHVVILPEFVWTVLNVMALLANTTLFGSVPCNHHTISKTKLPKSYFKKATTCNPHKWPVMYCYYTTFPVTSPCLRATVTAVRQKNDSIRYQKLLNLAQPTRRVC